MLRIGAVGELCRLRLEDTPIGLGQNVLVVYKGKGQKDRDVALSSRLAAALGQYIENIRPATLPRHIRKADFTRPVFYNQRRRPFTASGIYRLVRSAGERAGLAKRLTPHKLRHTSASNALARGMDLRTLQAQLGHSDITVTELYTHVIDSHKLDAVERVDTPLVKVASEAVEGSKKGPLKKNTHDFIE